MLSMLLIAGTVCLPYGAMVQFQKLVLAVSLFYVIILDQTVRRPVTLCERRRVCGCFLHLGLIILLVEPRGARDELLLELSPTSP